MQEFASPNVLAPGPEVASLLDNLIMVRQVEIASQLKRVISVVKIRDSAFNSTLHEFTIGNGGLRIALPLGPVVGATTGVANLPGL
jgi:circadian clock protein KaiC